jgi:hypothetical protein
VWRSICVEGHGDHDSLVAAINLIKQEILKLGHTEADLQQHVWTVGYPEFVARAADALITPPTTN